MEHIYAQIEQEIRFEDNQDLTMNLVRQINFLDSKNQKKNLRYEVYLLDFKFHEGQLLPFNKALGRNEVEEQEYPSLTYFNDGGLEYIEKRIQFVDNNILKGRYNQFLWSSIKKHHKYAKSAIDSYLEYLNDISWSNWETYIESEYSQIFKNSYCLSIQSKYKLEEHAVILREFLNNNEVYLQQEKARFLDFMLSHKYFKKDTFQGAELICEQLFEKIIQQPNTYFGDFLKGVAVKLSSKLGISQNIWHTKLGQVYEAYADIRREYDISGIIPLRMYQDAMRNYKQAGNKELYNLASKKFKEQQARLKLTKIEIPIQEDLVNALHEFNFKNAEMLCKHESEYIYNYLMFGGDLLPSEKIITTENKDTWINELIGTKIEFDINKNITKRSNSNSNLLNGDRFQNYHFAMNINFIPYLQYIFIQGIKSNKINFKSLIQYFNVNTWIGTELEESNSAGEIRKYNWLSMISPSIYVFFNELTSALKSNGVYNPVFMLSIESLSIKFEGLLRDIAKRMGLNTIKVVREGTKEMSIEDILREGKTLLLEYYDESDLFLFYYIYTKQGINLRNNVAHCYFRYIENYKIYYMFLLILSILRLGKVEISKK